MRKLFFVLIVICFSYGSLFAQKRVAFLQKPGDADNYSIVASGTYGSPATINTASLATKTYYVAPNGNDSYPGTFEQPFATWQKGFEILTAGQTLYIRGGTYTGMKGLYKDNYYGVRVGYHDGTETEPITVSAYPGETPILDCVGLVSANGSHDGLLLDGCSYWNIIGLTVINVSEDTNHNPYQTANGISLGDCNHVTLRQCTSRNNGGGFAGGGDYVYFINCDAYENNDVYDNGGYANGFSCNRRLGDHVCFSGCRAWLNSDDGYDLYGGDEIAVFDNCWAFENGYWNGYRGNGEGFKTGRVYNQSSGIVRTLTNCLSFDNLGFGFDESQDNFYTGSVSHVIYNNTSCRNSQGFTFGYTGAYTDIIKNNISFGEKAGNFGANTVQYNSWQNGHSVTAADFISVNSTGVKGARQTDGSLPDLNFLHLAIGSDLIDAGIDVGLPYSGPAPDLGAYEFNVIPTGIEPAGNNSKIKVYPNAVSDELTIEIEGSNDRSGFEILNSIGQIVFIGSLSERTVVPTTNFSPGIYFIKLQNGNKIEVKKIIKI